MQQLRTSVKIAASALMLILIGLMPIIQPAPGFGYEQTKVLLFLGGVSLLGVLSVFLPGRIVWGRVEAAGILFLLALFASALLGLNSQNSIIGTNPYYQGWVMYAYLMLFFLLVRLIRPPVHWVIYIIVGTAGFVSIVAIYQYIQLHFLGIDIPTYAGRVVSTFGQPNFYSGYLLLSLPFAYGLWKKQLDSRTQLILAGLTGLILLGIVLSESRAAILLTGVVSMVFLLDQVRGHQSQIRLIFNQAVKHKILFALLGIFVLIFFWQRVMPEFVSPLSQEYVQLSEEPVEKRAYIYPLAWALFLDRPLIGYGLENIALAFANYFRDNYYTIFEANLNTNPAYLSLKDITIDRAHNYLLDLLLSGGAIGLISWGVWVWLVLRGAKNKQVLIGLVTYLIWAQLQNQSVVHLAYFYFLAGLSRTAD